MLDKFCNRCNVRLSLHGDGFGDCETAKAMARVMEKFLLV